MCGRFEELREQRVERKGLPNVITQDQDQAKLVLFIFCLFMNEASEKALLSERKHKENARGPFQNLSCWIEPRHGLHSTGKVIWGLGQKLKEP